WMVGIQPLENQLSMHTQLILVMVDIWWIVILQLLQHPMEKQFLLEMSMKKELEMIQTPIPMKMKKCQEVIDMSKDEILVPTNSTYDETDGENYYFELGEMKTVSLKSDCTRPKEFVPIYCGE